MLSKWWGAPSFDFDLPQLRDKTAFICIDDLELSWKKFCARFDLKISDDEAHGRLRDTLQQSAFQAALRNYWRDIRLLSIELMLDWTRTVPVTSVASSLAFEIVSGFLTGKQWRTGSEAIDGFDSLSPGSYLVAKARQFATSGSWRGGYVGRLDRFVGRVKDWSRPNMVGSRVYTFSGADDVESLLDSQLELLIVLSNADWGPNRSLLRQMDVWLDSRFEQVSSIEILRDRLKGWADRLNEESCLSIDHIGLLKERVSSGVSAQAAIGHVKVGLRATQQALEGRHEETLAKQPIDNDRLLEIGRYASLKGFCKEKGRFPVHLFAIASSDQAGEDFTLSFTQFHRGELTRMQLEPRAVNEQDYFADAVAQQVAIVVLNDVLRRSDIKEVAVQDAEAYWKALKAESQHILARGETPILLLDNATRPEWLWDWQHADYGVGHKRPDDLQVSRREGRGSGYLCDLNDIEVYVAPLPIGQSILLSREVFRTLTFTKYDADCYVKIDVKESAGSRNLIDLMLTFSRKVEVGNSRAVRLVYPNV